MKKRLVPFVIIFLFLSGLIFINKPDTPCVNLYIDYGSLDNKTISTECITISNKTNALDILDRAEYKIEGTQKYGNAIVCRVNGLPDKKVESCEIMPPAEAFWAVIIKKKEIIPPLSTDWGWAQKGINETYLSSGDSLGLVFSTNGEVKWP
jgi:hypothetical protein